MVAQDGEDEASWSARRAELKAKHSNGNGCGTPLAMAVRLWPTARSADSESCGNHPEAMDSLTGATGHWTTPNVPERGRESEESKERRGSGGIDLQTQTENWPTAQATDDRNTSGGRGPDKNPGLRIAAQRWPTPGSNDDKGSNEIGQRRGQLDEATERRFHTSPPAQPTPVGQASSSDTPNSRRRLNPRFVAWLMGWPPIDASGCGFSEMESWKSKALWQFASCMSALSARDRAACPGR